MVAKFLLKQVGLMLPSDFFHSTPSFKLVNRTVPCFETIVLTFIRYAMLTTLVFNNLFYNLKYLAFQCVYSFYHCPLIPEALTPPFDWILTAIPAH